MVGIALIAVLIVGVGAVILTMGGSTLDASVTIPDECPTSEGLDSGIIAASLKTSGGDAAGSGQVTFDADGDNCAMSISVPVTANAEEYVLYLDVQYLDIESSEERSFSIPGPTITADDLAESITFMIEDFPILAGAQARALAKGAQSNLRNGLVAALTYFADSDSFEGFDATVAAEIEPALTYDESSTASPGVVSIRDVSADTVLLVTQSEDGQTFCIGRSGETTTYGTIDARTVPECAEASWPDAYPHVSDDDARLTLIATMASAAEYIGRGRTLERFANDSLEHVGSITYNASPQAIVGEVSLRDVTRRQILLVTKSDSGTTLCVVLRAGPAPLTYGIVDAETAGECADAAWPE